MYRAVSDLLASRDDPLARADGVANAAPVVRVLMMVLWLGVGYGYGLGLGVGVGVGVGKA